MVACVVICVVDQVPLDSSAVAFPIRRGQQSDDEKEKGLVRRQMASSKSDLQAAQTNVKENTSDLRAVQSDVQGLKSDLQVRRQREPEPPYHEHHEVSLLDTSVPSKFEVSAFCLSSKQQSAALLLDSPSSVSPMSIEMSIEEAPERLDELQAPYPPDWSADFVLRLIKAVLGARPIIRIFAAPPPFQRHHHSDSLTERIQL